MQQFDVTIVNKYGRKHSDADCLSRAPTDPPPQDSAFFGVVTESDQAAHQRADPNLRIMIDSLQGRNVVVPRAFKRNLPALNLKTSVHVKENLSP